MDVRLAVPVIRLPPNLGMEKFKKVRGKEKNLFVYSALEFIMFLHTWQF